MSRASLVHEHRPLARRIAREFYWPGAERQDVEQEALIALWAAAESFDPGAGSKFSSFAKLVIRRRLGTRVKLALGLKHRALNESLRHAQNAEGDLVEVLEFVPGGRDPADIVIARETLDRLVAAVGDLSPLERAALMRVVNQERGDGYDKQTDNAVSRARRKLKAAA